MCVGTNTCSVLNHLVSTIYTFRYPIMIYSPLYFLIFFYFLRVFDVNIVGVVLLGAGSVLNLGLEVFLKLVFLFLLLVQFRSYFVKVEIYENVFKTEGTVFPYPDRARPVNNVFI